MMQTVINWRPYPEQKPDAEGWHTVLHRGHGPIRAFWDEGRRGVVLKRFTDGNRIYGIQKISHFAMPEDIHTGEKP